MSMSARIISSANSIPEMSHAVVTNFSFDDETIDDTVVLKDEREEFIEFTFDDEVVEDDSAYETIKHPFGTKNNKEFDINYLRKIVEEDEDIPKAQYYLSCYFIKFANDEVGVWKAGTRTMEVQKANKTGGIPNVNFNYGKRGKEVFNPAEYYKNYVNVFNRGCDMHKPKVYYHKGAYVYNQFTRSPFYEVTKKFSDYSPETQEIVAKLWKHIKAVLTSNETEADYVYNWIMKLVTGHKMHSGIYCKSDYGVGKSTIYQILQAVMGESCTMTEIIEDLVGNNSFVCGKSLVVLDEIQCQSKNKAMDLNERLRNYITGTQVRIKEKYLVSFSIPNTVSLMLITNNDALTFGVGERRWFVSSPSNTILVNNTAYFDQIYEYIKMKEVHEAFYIYCRENYNDKWSERILVKTDELNDRIIESLPALAVFIKSRYICNNIGMLCSFDQLYKDYKSYCLYSNIKAMSSIAVSKYLEKIGLPRTKSGVVKYNYTYEQLYNIFSTKKWLHDSDIPYTP